MTGEALPGAAERSGGVSALLENDNSFWLLATLVFGAVAFFKGFRLPGTWASTQAQFGYDHGFAKRALFGAVLTRPLHLWIYGRLALVSTMILAGLMAALGLFARWSGAAGRVTPPAVATAVFFTSYSITFLAYLNGMLEIPEGLLAIGLLWIRNPLLRLLAGLPVVTIALLTHELFLLVFMPVLLLSFVMNASLEQERTARWRVLGYGMALGVFAVVVTILIAMRPSFTTVQVLAYQNEIASRANFPLQSTFYLVLSRSLGDNLRLMETFFVKGSWWLDLAGGFVTVMPVILFLLWLVRRILQDRKIHGQRWVFLACVTAAFAPLSMNVIGFDVGRWWALTGVTTFLVYGVICGYVPGPPIELRPVAMRAAMLIVALNMATGDGLIDPGTTIQAYPYTTEIKATIKSMLLHQWP